MKLKKNDLKWLNPKNHFQPANIDSNISRESQIYGIIPYMAPELFKNQPYSYASDIYSLGMIMWQLTSGHRPFHDQEHGPKLILNILDGKRPEITEDTPERWVNLMKRYDDIWFEFNEAEEKRLEMVESKKPFVKNPGYEHPDSRYYSRSLNSISIIPAAQIPNYFGIMAAKICQNYLESEGQKVPNPKLILAPQINFGIPN
ncbi:hypothetical protein Glove_346g205 [Diversispora epigaea]|uniref:Protein kinase domain-containing protein n=1 Tax=Diversispora epigaea TaxID=1348612 RepID=A0A397HFT5_9GLOM|nr:hypothetical protein Glove_346g205 [Diversispora epigaea]